MGKINRSSKKEKEDCDSDKEEAIDFMKMLTKKRKESGDDNYELDNILPCNG